MALFSKGFDFGLYNALIRGMKEGRESSDVLSDWKVLIKEKKRGKKGKKKYRKMRSKLLGD